MQAQYETMEVTSSTEWRMYATLQLIVVSTCLQVAPDSLETPGKLKNLSMLVV